MISFDSALLNRTNKILKNLQGPASSQTGLVGCQLLDIEGKAMNFSIQRVETAKEQYVQLVMGGRELVQYWQPKSKAEVLEVWKAVSAHLWQNCSMSDMNWLLTDGMHEKSLVCATSIIAIADILGPGGLSIKAILVPFGRQLFWHQVAGMELGDGPLFIETTVEFGGQNNAYHHLGKHPQAKIAAQIGRCFYESRTEVIEKYGAIQSELNLHNLQTLENSSLSRISRAYVLMKDYEKAIEFATRSIEVGMAPDFAHYIRGISYCGLGEYKMAIMDYKQVLEQRPDFDKAREKLRQARELSMQVIEA